MNFFKSFKRNIIIFSDLDGTFMDHHNYSFKILKNYVKKIKYKCLIIFTSSKTFDEIIEINKSLDLEFPFITENGACIFFPRKSINLFHENFFEHNSYVGYKVSQSRFSLLKKKLEKLKKKYKFRFYSELNIRELKDITNLTLSRIRASKKRMFSDPIYWEDSITKKKNFEIDVNNLGYSINFGGRFIHLSYDYDKGVAVEKFLNLINFKNNNELITISLGDSQNDQSMLEITDYSCIIKTYKNKEILLKKKMNNYYSKKTAPDGWKESLNFIFEEENVNF